MISGGTLSIKYGGTELNDLIAVSKYDTQLLPSSSPNAVDIGHTDGQTLLSNKHNTRTITVTYYLRSPEFKETLAGRLSTLTPLPLVFGDQPHLSYNCVPVGGETLEKGYSTKHDQKTMTFIAYDPYIYDDRTVTADNRASSSDNLAANTGDLSKIHIVDNIYGTTTGKHTTSGSSATVTNSNKAAINLYPTAGYNFQANQSVTIAVDASCTGTASIVFGYFDGASWTKDSQQFPLTVNTQRIVFSRVLSSVNGNPYFSVNILCKNGAATVGSIKLATDEDDGSAPDMTWSPAAGEDGYALDNITINNPGGLDAPINLEAVMNSDCGFFGASIDSNGTGVIAGSEQGQQVANGETTDVQYDTTFGDRKLIGQVNKYPSFIYPSAPITGVFEFVNLNHNIAVHPKTFGTPDNAKKGDLYGVSLYMPFKKAYQNCLTYTGLHLYSNIKKEYGEFEVSFVDANGSQIMGIRMWKTEGKDRNIQMEMYVGSDIVASWTTSNKKSWEMKNFLGFISMRKEGNVARFSLRNKNTKESYDRGFTYDSLTTQQVFGVNYYFGRWAKQTTFDTNLLNAHAYGYQTKWTRTNNLFVKGAVLDIDSSTNVPYVYTNSIATFDVAGIDNQALIAPAGQSTSIGLECSDGSLMPTVTATIQPRYI